MPEMMDAGQTLIYLRVCGDTVYWRQRAFGIRTELKSTLTCLMSLNKMFNFFMPFLISKMGMDSTFEHVFWGYQKTDVKHWLVVVIIGTFRKHQMHRKHQWGVIILYN